jgi:hypothetical protein
MEIVGRAGSVLAANGGPRNPDLPRGSPPRSTFFESLHRLNSNRHGGGTKDSHRGFRTDLGHQLQKMPPNAKSRSRVWPLAAYALLVLIIDALRMRL